MTANQDIDLKAFYIRRFFRIIPPYVAALAGIGLVAWLGFIHLQSWEIPSCLLFLRNYEPTVAPPGGPYDPYGFYTVHFWSLSLEEHFYLIWAPLLALLKPRRAVKAALILAATVVLWRVVDGHYQIMLTAYAVERRWVHGQTPGSMRCCGAAWQLCFFPISEAYFVIASGHGHGSRSRIYLVVLERYHLPLFQLQLGVALSLSADEHRSLSPKCIGAAVGATVHALGGSCFPTASICGSNCFCNHHVALVLSSEQAAFTACNNFL